MVGRMFSGNFTRHIVQSLGRSIAFGEFPSGLPLKAEAELCHDFDASRTVLREAVKMLTAKGMLDARPLRETIVLPESQWNLSDPEILNWLLDRKGSLPIISEFAEMRLAIEPAACALAAKNINKQSRQTLLKAIVTEHQGILDFIVDGDPQSAENAMRELLENSKLLINSKIEKQNNSKKSEDV